LPVVGYAQEDTMRDAVIDRPNRLLLQAAMCTLLVALVLAWLLVFTKGLPVEIIVRLVANYERLLQAHIDYLIMSGLLMGFYAVGVRLPGSVQVAMAIGVFTNPAGFLYLAFWPTAINLPFIVFSILSFVLTTYGFAMAALTVLRASLHRTGVGETQATHAPQ
jgi:hypothetical protein